MTTLIGVIQPRPPLIGVIVTSQIRPVGVMVELNPAEFIVNVNEASGGTIRVVSLPLKGLIPRGRLSRWLVTIVAKAHATPPTDVDIELLDDDSVVSTDPEIFVPGGGTKNLALSLTKAIAASTFVLGAGQEKIVNRSWAARKNFVTKGTAGNLLLAFRFNGGTSIVYQLVVQVYGEGLSSS